MPGADEALAVYTFGDLFPPNESTPWAGFWTHSSFKRRVSVWAAQLCPRDTEKQMYKRNKNESAWRHDTSGGRESRSVWQWDSGLKTWSPHWFVDYELLLKIKLKCPKLITKYIKHTSLLTYSLWFQMHPIKKTLPTLLEAFLLIVLN